MEGFRLKHELSRLSLSRQLTQHQIAEEMANQKEKQLKMNRFLRAKKYFTSQAQLHMNSIKEEMLNLRRLTTTYRVNARNRLGFKKTAEEFAKKYVQLQGELFTYNAVLEVQAAPRNHDQILFQTSLVKENNKLSLNKLDILVGYKIKREEKISALRNEIDIREQTIMCGISDFSEAKKIRYLEVCDSKNKCKQKMDKLQKDISECKSKIKGFLETDENLKLQKALLLKNFDKTVKERNDLQEQLESSVPDSQQRKILLLQLKNNQAEITSLEKVKDDLIEELKTKTERLSEMNKTSNAGNTNRSKKHEDLRNRDEFISQFIMAFPESSGKLRNDIIKIQDQIIHALKIITYNSINDLKELDEIQLILDKVPDRDLQLNWLKVSKNKCHDQLIALKNKTGIIESEISSMEEENQKSCYLENELEVSCEKRNVLQQTFETIVSLVNKTQRRQSELEAQVYGNEVYQQICKVETDFEFMVKENERLRDDLITVPVYEKIDTRMNTITKLVSDRNNYLTSVLNKRNKASDNNRQL